MLRLALRPVFAVAAFVLFNLRNKKLRGYFFAYIRRRFPGRLVCVDSFDHPYVINTADNGTSRELFGSGQLDLEKFRRVTELLSAEELRRRNLLVDVGANLGTICIPLVAADYFNRAIAIEPDPENLRLLRTNIALSGLHEKIQVVGQAAAAESGVTISLEQSPINSGDHRVAVSKTRGMHREDTRQQIEVQTVAIDDVVEPDRINEVLIWMDVQGYEGWALAGAERTLSNTPPLVIEFWPYGLHRAEWFDALKTALQPYGLFIDLADPSAKRRNIEELPALYREIGGGGEYTDLLLLPT